MSNKLRLSIALVFSAPSILFAADTLIFAVDLIRHGDRTPIFSLPAVNHHWQEGLGQLTAEGMQQEFKMGTEFRKRYIENTHLLPEHYVHGTMYVRSTSYDRTLMSAQSLLMGLYPPGTGPSTELNGLPALPHAYQPIPIFSAPARHDDVIIQPVSSAEHEKLMDEHVHSTKEWQDKNNALKDKYPLWSQLTGVQIDSLDDLQLVGDALFIHQLHKAPMPTGLNEEDIQTIINSSQWAFMAEEGKYPIAKAYSSKLMKNIASMLSNGSLQKSKLKYVLLSAHDTTISTAMTLLGAPLAKAPRYASNLNFSLYERGNDYYVVKVTYNDEPVVIPACGGDTCELQQYLNLTQN